MTDAPKTIAEMREAEAMVAENATYAKVSLCCNGRECGCQGASVGEYVAHLIRAIPLPADDAEAKHGERIDYTAAQLQAMGEAYAAAYADAKAKQDAEDAEMVERIIENAAFRAALDAYLVAVGDNKLEDEFEAIDAAARAALSAMRGEQ